jgi:L-threonylcarbamoyladenylate synthase
VVGQAAAALERGEVVVLPTDTVYGLAVRADSEDALRRLYEAKGRASGVPSAVVAASVDALVDLVPELRATAGKLLHGLLPGAYTLVVSNPARRLAWLNPDRPEALGVRVPAVTGAGLEVLTAAGPVVATSANLPGGPDPVRIADVPCEILERVAVIVDGGALPGVPSTVVDFTTHPPTVLREGAGDIAAALALARP